ncbi:MAG: class I tRNA ligase family protein, partial [Chthoniobacterales bacterium]
FDEKQVEEGRNFATKLWNAARFRQMHGPSEATPDLSKHTLSIYAIEVLARLDATIDVIEDAYRSYRFSEVAQALYDFFWGDYCDWFVEAAKTDIFAEEPARKAAVLAVMDHALSAVLRLLHPFMPHITEELWALLALGGESIQFEAPPRKLDAGVLRAGAQERVKALYELVQAGRNLRSESRLPSNKKAQFVLQTTVDWVEAELPTLSRLLNAESVSLEPAYEAAPGVPIAATSLGKLHLLMVGGDKEAEAERLDREIAKLETDLQATVRKLSNSSFVDKAPPEVVTEHKQRQVDFTEKLTQLRAARQSLE